MEKIISTRVSEELKDSYLSYSMAVICGRAIPDVRDGLKPVHRRILTAMKDLGLKSDGPFRKSARVGGETTGKYHPHGGAYGPMVTLAAPYRNNHRLIDGHGNWGSETDSPAADRYTECKLTSYTEDVLLQDFAICEKRPNYDGSLQEPVVLESSLPNLLITGSEGIGVGYSTNIPQHNLRGVVQATKSVLKGRAGNLIKPLTPDFPSGCDIVMDDGLKQYIATGHGGIRMRAKSQLSVLKRGGRKQDWGKIEFTNLPWGVSTEKVGIQIRDSMEKGKITDVISLVDETDRTGQRLVVYTKKGKEDQVLSSLYRFTSLDCKFSGNNTVISEGVPKSMPPVGIIQSWLAWRDERLVVKFTAERESKMARVHVLEGLLKAVSILEKVIAKIRRSADTKEAKKGLMGRGFNFTEAQAVAILQLRLQSLTGLDIKVLKKEKGELEDRIVVLSKLIGDKGERELYIEEELTLLAKRHGNKRKCEVIEPPTEQVVVSSKGKPKAPASLTINYYSANLKKGILTKKKTPRGCSFFLSSNDKIIVATRDGWLKKLPANYKKGACFDVPKELALLEKASTASETKYIAVWKRDGFVWSATLKGEQFTRTTSKGKRWLPEGSELVYIGKEDFVLKCKGRTKDKTLGVYNVKERNIGSVGNKIISLEKTLLSPQKEL